MKLTKILFFGALASIVAGDENDGEESPTAADPCGKTSKWTYFKITNTAQRDLMTECTEITHILWIDKDYPGVFSLPKLKNVSGIYLRDVSSRASSTRIASGSLTGVSFPALVDSPEIKAANLESLTGIDLPKLAFNKESLELTNLPALKTFNGFKSVESTEFVKIIGTGITEIGYTNMKAIRRLTITDNPSLDNIKFGVDSNITEIDLACGNNPLPRFSGPTNVVNLEINQCTAPAGDQRTTFEGIKTMIADSEVERFDWPDYAFSSNNFTRLAFPNLTQIVGYLSAWESENLKEVAFPVLETVEGSLRVSYGERLDVVVTEETFPLLRNVSRLLSFTGHFSDIDLPSRLQSAQVKIESTNYRLNCSKFDPHRVTKLGMSQTSLQVECTAAPSPSSGSGGYSGGGGSSSSSTSASPPFQLPPRFIAAIVVSICSTIFWICVIYWLCVRRKRRRVKREAEMAALQAQLVSIGDRLPPQEWPQQGALTDTRDQSSSALPMGKAELMTASVAAESQASVPTLNLTREEELEARERALEARERELDIRQSRGNV